MPGGSSEFDIRRLASLARLTLTPAEQRLFPQQLARILSYAEAVTAVDTAGVPPTTHAMAPRLRERPDVVEPSLEPSAAGANAPDLEDGLFRVPKVLG